MGPGAMRPEPTGEKPTWEGLHEPCPNCGADLCRVYTPVKPPPMLRVGPSGQAVAVYLGCPACPYAGPAVTMAKENAGA